MDSENTPAPSVPGRAAKKSSEPLSREQLYDMVWQEPMLRVAEQLGVSSSYMARVCSELRVPRPSQGHWAKLEFGKPSEQPPLPPMRPGDVTVWDRSKPLGTTQRTVVERAAPRRSRPLAGRNEVAKDARHVLLVGVRPLFTKTRASDIGLLRPFKKVLVDIVVSEAHLDQTLDNANALFKSLTAHGHRVILAPADLSVRRAELDVREVPEKTRSFHTLWSPDRPTVVYIGDVPIGLTLFEMTEEVEVVYVNGEYLAVSTLTPAQAKRYQGTHHWRTKKSKPSGRLCLQAYCPRWDVPWTKQWRETKAGQLLQWTAGIVKELESARPNLEALVEAARIKAEAESRRRDEEWERYRIEAERERMAKARIDAKKELLAAIAAWDEARRVHAYFGAVEEGVFGEDEQQRERIGARVAHARALIGPLDPVDLLLRWKAPEER
jgi:hypothetical protein